ncbi:MAG: MarR family winged helix-turn-helix transcriptional regulator [Methyloligellaceae bacterium]
MNENQRKQGLFQLFNEVGIIYQLATTIFNRRLPDGLHISHFSVINHMCRLGDGCTPLALANAFQVTKATMTNTLNKLSARKFIEIRPNPEDGRSKLVYLTKAGRDFSEIAVQGLAPTLEQLDKDLDLEELLKILPQLRTLREYLDTHREE